MKLKKNTYFLASIIGHLYGDGGIAKKGRIHYCNTEEFLIKEFVQNMKKVFKYKPYIIYENNIIRVKYPARFGRIFWNTFGKFSSGKDTKTITSQINKMPLKWKVKMLTTWFNDDGSVPKNGNRISIKQKLKPLILFIQETFKQFQIKSQIVKDGNMWHLRTTSYDGLTKFRKHIGFSKNYRKSKELDDVISKIKDPHFVTKNKILKLLKQSPKTRKELTKFLNLESGTIYGHLHGWKRKIRTNTKGLVDFGLVKLEKLGRINIYSIENKIK